VLSRTEAAGLAEATAGLDLDRLVACVKACGFDENTYLLNHPDLQSAGSDAAATPEGATPNHNVSDRNFEFDFLTGSKQNATSTL